MAESADNENVKWQRSAGR